MPKHDPTEKTKSDILATATRLFQERGWENINIEDIVNEVGVTRGAFYHYFKSRDELVYAVVAQMYLENNPFTIASKEKGLNALEKLRFVCKHDFNQQMNPAMAKDLKKALDNPVVFKSHFLLSVNYSATFIEKLLIEGNEDGSMSVSYPKQVAQTLSLLFNLWFDPDILQVSHQEFVDKVLFLEKLCNSLGIPLFNEELMEITLSCYR